MVAVGFDRRQVLAWLDEVKDPEVPVLSVVELGVVRDATIADDGHVTVTLTPTYSGCPAMREIETGIRDTLWSHGVAAVTLKTVYSPAWTTDWMPESAKAKLEAYGIAPPGHAEHDEVLVPLRRAGATPRCPWCKSAKTELRSQFGSTACKSLCWCNECGQPFEMFKAI